VGPRAGLDPVTKRETSAPVRNRIPFIQPVILVTVLTELSRFLVKF